MGSIRLCSHGGVFERIFVFLPKRTAGKFARACDSFACVNEAFASRRLRGIKQYFIQFLNFQTKKSSALATELYYNSWREYGKPFVAIFNNSFF